MAYSSDDKDRDWERDRSRGRRLPTYDLDDEKYTNDFPSNSRFSSRERENRGESRRGSKSWASPEDILFSENSSRNRHEQSDLLERRRFTREQFDDDYDNFDDFSEPLESHRTSRTSATVDRRRQNSARNDPDEDYDNYDPYESYRNRDDFDRSDDYDGYDNAATSSGRNASSGRRDRRGEARRAMANTSGKSNTKSNTRNTKANAKAKPKKKSSGFGKVIKIFFSSILLLFLLVAGAGCAGVAWYIIKISEELPSMVEVANPKSSVASVMYDRNGEVIARLFIENRTILELNQISPWLIKSVLAAEDSAFYQHSGIRIGSILRALWVDVVEHGRVQGASTITQQLARNLFLSQEKSMTRKAKEALIAMRMEKLFTKDRILEMYLNTINFGQGAWGAETAARTYFSKSAAELDIAESAILAGLIANPGRYNPLSNMDNAKSRQNYVLSRMETLGWLDSEQRKTAYNEELVFKKQANKIEEFNRAPYFVSHLLFNDLLPKYGKDQVYSGGLQIYTTIDINLQIKAQEAIQSLTLSTSKNKVDPEKDVMGALVCLSAESGEVLALVGGKDFKTSKFNRATQAFRQPGSSFKPIVYAAALEEGIMPSDHFLDAPITFGRAGKKGWSPKNSSGSYAGEVTVQRALTSSINTVAVRAAAFIGTDNVVKMARSMGIESKYLPNDLSVALGSASLPPLEMAVAFNCFNNGGKRVVPLTIREIRDADGNILETREPTFSQAMHPETAYTLRSMMLDTVRAGTGGKAKVKNTETFGKTGTSNDFIDAWFVGGTPGLTTAVYVGRDDHKTMGRVGFGGTIAAPVWQSFMSYAVEKQGTPSKFPATPKEVDVTRISICRTTGYRAANSCPAVPVDFPKGKAPTAKCPTHGGSYSAAQADPNGPRLFLVEKDESVLAQLEAKEAAKQAKQESVTPPAMQPSATPPQQIPTPAPRRDPTPADEVERRYQELLKEYGLQ